MHASTGAYENHATLLALEVLAVPAAVLAATVALLLATGVLAAATALGGLLDVGDAALAAVADLVVLATFLVLVGLGGLAVVGYRRVIDERFDAVDPTALLAVPAAAIVVAVGYGAFARGTASFPWWLFGIVAVAAHALAYRTVAIDSVLAGRRREGVVVGTVAAVPAVVALVSVVDGTLWSGTVSAALLSAAPGTEAGTALRRAVLVAVPFAVTALYGVDHVGIGDDLDVPDWRALVDRATDGLPGVPIGRRSGRRRSGRRRSVVPSSPDSPGSDGSGSGAGKKSTDGSGSAATGERAPSAPAPSAPASSSRGGSSAGRSAGGDSDDGGRSTANDEGTGSDTRIFVDDFDGSAPDETPVGVCPDCEKDIPSDGVYQFCPFCGHEL